MSGRVEGLDLIRGTLRRLREAAQVKGIRVRVPDGAERVIGFLAGGGRDITQPSPVMEREVDVAVQQGMARVAQGAPSGTPWQMAGEAILRRLRLRVAQGGADLTFRPLAASTVKAKGSTRLFVRTGQLLRDLSGSKTTVTRT